MSTINTLSQIKATKIEIHSKSSLQAGSVPLQRRQNTRNSSSLHEESQQSPPESPV